MAKRPIFVKFRATEAQRDSLIKAAELDGTTSSALLRRFAGSLRNGGRPQCVPSRAEWVAVRQAANEVLTFADAATLPHSPAAAERIRIAASNLHRLASRHLGPVE